MNLLPGFSLLCHLLLYIALLVSSTAYAQDENDSDTGTSDPVLNSMQWLENELARNSNLLTATQRISLLKRYEGELRKEIKGKPESVQQQQLLEMASRYWQERAFVEANGIYGEVVEVKPQSLEAAKAYMMMGYIKHGNMMKPAEAIAPLEKSLEILRELELPSEDIEQKNSMAAQVASTLGDVYMLDKQDVKAEEVYRLLLDDKELAGAADINSRINANVEMARILVRQERFEEASERFSEGRALIAEAELPSETKLAFALEHLAVKSRSGASPSELIAFLEELWEQQREKEEDLNTLRLGNYLVLSYFFSSDDKQRKKFREFQVDYFKVAQQVWKKCGKELEDSPEQRRDYYLLVQQARLLRLELAETEKDKGASREALVDFLKCLDEFRLPFLALVPAQFPMQFVEKVMGIYQARIKPELKSRGKNEAGNEIDLQDDREATSESDGKEGGEVKGDGGN